MNYTITIERDDKQGKLQFHHGSVLVDTTCWWDLANVIGAGTYTGYATRMASKTDGSDGGKREAIWFGTGVPLGKRMSNAIFIHKGTGPSWSDGCIVAAEKEVLKIWKAITPKESPNVTIVVKNVSHKARETTRDLILTQHQIVKRSRWGATGPWKPLTENWAYTAIVVHHSGNWGETDPKEIQIKHKKKSFDDIGYHYLIHPNGTCYEGREILYKGEHVAGANSNKIGILMMGDYDTQWWDSDDELTSSHLDKLKALSRTLMKCFPITKFGGHKEYLPGKGYTCPGNLLMAQMAALRQGLGLRAP